MSDPGPYMASDQTHTFSDGRLRIVEFCAIECELQGSGERSVSWMLNAWQYAFRMCEAPPTVADVKMLGQLVEPVKNSGGWREVGVRVGHDVKGDWRVVPRQMANLCGEGMSLEPAEWFREYEEVHPFIDGNGRTGQILFNWLLGTLHQPEWAPNFWHDPRREADQPSCSRPFHCPCGCGSHGECYIYGEELRLRDHPPALYSRRTR